MLKQDQNRLRVAPTADQKDEEHDSPFRVVPARTKSQKDQVYSLRYRAYRSVEAIQQDRAERFSDAYDRRPNSRSYLLTAAGRPAASIRASVWLPEDNMDGAGAGPAGPAGLALPCFETYRDAVEERIGLDQRIVESSRFVITDLPFDLQLRAQYELFRMIVANGQAHRADWVVTAVRRKHVPVYRRLFGLKRLSEPRTYFGLNVEMILVGCEFRRQLPIACERNPRLRMSDLEVSRFAL